MLAIFWGFWDVCERYCQVVVNSVLEPRKAFSQMRVQAPLEVIGLTSHFLNVLNQSLPYFIHAELVFVVLDIHLVHAWSAQGRAEPLSITRWWLNWWLKWRSFLVIEICRGHICVWRLDTDIGAVCGAFRQHAVRNASLSFCQPPKIKIYEHILCFAVEGAIPRQYNSIGMILAKCVGELHAAAKKLNPNRFHTKKASLATNILKSWSDLLEKQHHQLFPWSDFLSLSQRMTSWLLSIALIKHSRERLSSNTLIKQSSNTFSKQCV